MGRQPAVIASNDDASPLREPPALLRTSRMLCLGLGTGFVSGCIDPSEGDLYRCTNAWTDDGRMGTAPLEQLPAPRAARRGVPLGGRLGARALAGLGGLLEPPGLSVDIGHAHAGAGAPRAAQLAGRTAEVGDHLAAAAAGHTLPRPMGRRCLILAVAVLACHELSRLAFRA